MRRRAQRWWLGMVLAATVLATRWPLAPRQLFSFDDVNFAWAIGRFDVRDSQPHPPGYPLFVLQMRLLDVLRFKRAQSNLLALSLLGSVAALLLAVRFGNRFLGRDAGLCAAWLLALYPSFWYAGLTSAVRVQLAVVSLAAAAACYRAWRGEKRWVALSALVLGLGAGVRPELGAMLLPLWAGSALRARARGRDWLLGLGLLAGSTLAWLVPTMVASGGPRVYLELCWKYLRDQAALTSPAFGADPVLWRTTVCRFLVWLLAGTPAWTLPLALLWGGLRVRQGDPGRAAFLALWLLPPAAFALSVHVADAGQTLGMVPAVCLAGGWLVSRAADRIAERPSRWHGLIWTLTAGTLAAALHFLSAGAALLVVPLVGLAAGWAMRQAPCTAPGCPPRSHAVAFLLGPALFLHLVMFLHPIWYYKGPPGVWHAVLEDLHSGLAFTTLEQVRTTAAVDDRALRAIRHLTEKHPRLAVILWERGLLSWRKAAYYYPYLPVVVLDRKTLAGPQQRVVTVWRGPRIEQRIEGQAPLRIPLPRGGRLVWLLNPKTDLPARLREQFVVGQMDSVSFCDLPETGGERRVGDFLLVW